MLVLLDVSVAEMKCVVIAKQHSMPNGKLGHWWHVLLGETGASQHNVA